MSELKEDITRKQKHVKLFEGLVVRILSNYHTLSTLLDAEERTGVLSRTAPSFFTMLNDLLVRDFFLESAKILEARTSPIKGGTRQNLTVSLFVEQAGWTEEQQSKLNEFSVRLKEFYPWIKDARDKIIGHNDLLTYEDNPDGLGAFESGLEIEFVKSLEEFYNYLHEISFGKIWGEFTPNVEPGSIYELLAELYHGLAFDAVINDVDTPNDLSLKLTEKSLEIKQAIKG